MTLRLDSAAAEEFLRAVEYYDERSPGLGAELISDFEGVCEHLLSAPMSGSPGPAGTRRLLLSRFPFSVVYLIRDDQPIVVAFAHQRRRPGYWIDRI